MTFPGYGTFKRGGVTYPLATGTGNSLLQDADPAVFYVLAYLKAVLNAHMGTRLAAGGIISTAVAQVIPFDPRPVLTQEQFKFPLLAAYRVKTVFNYKAVPLAHNLDTWDILYVLPPLTAGQMEQVLPILHAVQSIVDDRIEFMADPSYNGGASIDTLAGFESFFLDASETGSLTNMGGDLFFPAWVGHATVREIKSTPAGAFEPFAGGDLSIKADESGTPFDIVEIKTDVTAP